MANSQTSKVPAIKVIDISMRYGAQLALRHLSFEVPPGEIYGFIGPNGAGKTTTMRIIATLLAPTSGEAFVFGYSSEREPDEVRRRMGFMPDVFQAYYDLSVIDYLRFFASAYGFEFNEGDQIIADILALTELDNIKNKRITGLSRGMKQRLSLARVLVHNPQVLILDEPASGLDPRARMELQNILLELQKMGKTILISSHILAELKEICTSIGIIEEGEMKYSGSLQRALQTLKPYRELRIEFLGAPLENKDILCEYSQIVSYKWSDSSIIVQLSPSCDDVSFLPKLLIDNGLKVQTISENKLKLEELFLRMTGGED